MNNVTLTGKPSDLRRVNLTRYTAVMVTFGPKNFRAVLATVAMPSEAYLNSDGSVSLSSRTTTTGASRLPSRATFTGLTRDGETEVITFK